MVSFYDDLTKLSASKVWNRLSFNHTLSEDVKQDILFRSLRSYVNKGNDPNTFPSFCQTTEGEKWLKGFIRGSKLDELLFIQGVKQKHDQRTLILMSAEDLMKLIDEQASDQETSITRTQSRIEAQDTLRHLYKTASMDKKEAMELMAEALNIKDNGKVVPEPLRKKLTRLRNRIQESDPQWKLDLSLL